MIKDILNYIFATVMISENLIFTALGIIFFAKLIKDKFKDK